MLQDDRTAATGISKFLSILFSGQFFQADDPDIKWATLTCLDYNGEVEVVMVTSKPSILDKIIVFTPGSESFVWRLLLVMRWLRI